MVERVRRVVTGHGTRGQSLFVLDGLAGNVKEMESMPGLALTDLWETQGVPADNTEERDAADRPVKLEPPKNGTIFRIVEFPPDSAWKDGADGGEAFSSIGAGHASDKGSEDPMMHKTATVDYLVVVKGEIWAVLEEGEVCLRQGDVMIQRGTNHSWSVRTDEPCVLAAVLVDAAAI